MHLFCLFTVINRQVNQPARVHIEIARNHFFFLSLIIRLAEVKNGWKDGRNFPPTFSSGRKFGPAHYLESEGFFCKSTCQLGILLKILKTSISYENLFLCPNLNYKNLPLPRSGIQYFQFQS